MASLNATISLRSPPAQDAPNVESRGLLVDFEIVGLGNGPQVAPDVITAIHVRSEEHTSELQSRLHLVCRLLLEKKKKTKGSSAAIQLLAGWWIPRCPSVCWR